MWLFFTHTNSLPEILVEIIIFIRKLNVYVSRFNFFHERIIFLGNRPAGSLYARTYVSVIASPIVASALENFLGGILAAVPYQ